MKALAKGSASAELNIKVTRANGDVEHLKGEAVAEYEPVYVVLECINIDGVLKPVKRMVISAEDADSAFSHNLMKQLEADHGNSNLD